MLPSSLPVADWWLGDGTCMKSSLLDLDVVSVIFLHAKAVDVASLAPSQHWWLTCSSVPRFHYDPIEKVIYDGSVAKLCCLFPPSAILRAMVKSDTENVSKAEI